MGREGEGEDLQGTAGGEQQQQGWQQTRTGNLQQAPIFGRQMEVIFFPQLPSHLSTAAGSAVPLETFRQPELAPVQTPALHSKGSQKLQALPKKLRDVSFFPWTPIRDREKRP